MPELPNFRSKVDTKHGRIGELQLQRNGLPIAPLKTPLLYPVTSFMTGVSTRGGGIWKYLLRDLMKRDIPFLTQVLHFMDFNLNPKHLKFWREMPIRERYREQNGDYSAPIFLDSGGFKLLYSTGLDLEQFGIHSETEADDILEMQLDFGGEIIASLDYPLPPNLARAEAIDRMDRSLQNAEKVANKLSELESSPLLYVCCHGQSASDIKNYVAKIFERIGDKLSSFGLAVGSLVPLRGNSDGKVLTLVTSAISGIPENRRNSTPIHAFGVSGALAPILAYLGVDTFDSTAYIQSARSLAYAEPTTMRKRKILEMDRIDCHCHVCREMDLNELHTALMEKTSYSRTSTGKYKSEYYSQIALHNFELDSAMLQGMSKAIEADSAMEELIELFLTKPRLQSVTEWISEKDSKFATRYARKVINMPGIKKLEIKNPDQLNIFGSPGSKISQRLVAESRSNYATNAPETVENVPTISLKFTPDSFKIPSDYTPPKDGKILLTIPCAGQKPYSKSRTHSIVRSRLEEAFGEDRNLIHKITLSGLYGPVPEEFENEEALLSYDFHLTANNRSQMQLGAKRFIDYLNRYGEHYELMVGYATSKAYRMVLESVKNSRSGFILLPKKPKALRLSEFFRHTNLDELIEKLSTIID